MKNSKVIFPGTFDPFSLGHLDVRSFLSDDVWNEIFPDYRQQDNILIGFIGGMLWATELA